MAQTRGATGNSKPRIFSTISTEPVRKRKTATGTKKRTTKPKSTGGAVKKHAPAADHKRKPTLKDKVEGAVEKVVGAIEHKPGKKAAGTKKMKGADDKSTKTPKVKKV
ncbi:uncharacterized protein Z518_04057 [Rhinocladiella mackenziei CBS 650.93]|uniref:Uncharacterized protein n=1 Tax=Rhinocladiella mackenziei CBS 650.93 TaxID=1442369 RepID=A0A0D2H6R4_9EURO|nr:uncharacterized protein Z518_04057 [Rhinocladiella mackenziei CBS 650.93]KIX06083.1 hypothetical protein Z518_04057 [Rhinocladiella mackenziei CBS 650.93]